MVASYALKKFNDVIEADVFKSVDEFVSHVEKKNPRNSQKSARGNPLKL